MGTPFEEEGEVASGKYHRMDYVEKDEVIKRIRLENEADWYLFMLKEKFDNAVDFLWKYYPNAPVEYKDITAKIKLDYGKKLFHCTVTNTNPDNKPVFSNLNHILNFDMTYGTKQNEYKITRGALGDAIKQLITLPYTLMEQDLQQQKKMTTIGGGNKQWHYPMVFRFNNKVYEATLNVDRFNQTIEATPILLTDKRVYSTPEEKAGNTTEIENIWCIIDKVRESPLSPRSYLDVSKIARYCKRYIIFTTDISFYIEIGASDNTGVVINVPASTKDPISSKWINTPSIFYYTLDQFETRLSSVHDKQKTTVFQLIHKLREWSRISNKKVPDLNIPIAEFLKDEAVRSQKIRELYLRLRTKGEVTKPPDKLSLPYTKKEERKKALAKRLADLYDQRCLDTSKAAYEIMQGIVEEVDHATDLLVTYPFAFEIVAVPYSEDIVRVSAEELGKPNLYKSEFEVGAINYSASPDYNVYESRYHWFDKQKNKKNKEELSAWNIVDIFSEYGFSFKHYDTNKQKTKLPCIIAANLISPKLTYRSEGKSDVDMTPFQQLIPQVVAKVARQIKTFRSAGIDTGESVEKVEKPPKPPKPPKASKVTIKKVVEMLLLPRIEKVLDARARSQPAPFFEEETQDSIWYDALPVFDKYHVNYSNKSRPGFKNEIRELCKLHDVAREEIGIIAAPWGSMFYIGEWYDISYHTVKDLAKNGTDIIFIEKRDIVQNLGKYASSMRIALVNTHGHLSESTKELAKLAETASKVANVAILTDYDIPGIHIAFKLRGVVRLGIDERTLRHFNIPHENRGSRLLVATYNPNKQLLDETIDEILEDKRFSSTDIIDIEFLKRKKVEIDAVLSDQGAENLWNYIVELLGKEKPRRNYKRVIAEDVYTYTPDPPIVASSIEVPYVGVKIASEAQSYIADRVDEITEEPKQEIEEDLEDHEGFILDVREREREIKEEIDEVRDEDEIIHALKEVVDKAVRKAQSDVVDEVKPILERAAKKAEEAVINGIKKLDTEKGYGIMEALSRREEDEGRPKIDTL